MGEGVKIKSQDGDTVYYSRDHGGIGRNHETIYTADGTAVGTLQKKKMSLVSRHSPEHTIRSVLMQHTSYASLRKAHDLWSGWLGGGSGIG